jgi:hypothetical protein
MLALLDEAAVVVAEAREALGTEASDTVAQIESHR